MAEWTGIIESAYPRMVVTRSRIRAVYVGVPAWTECVVESS